MLSNEKCLQTKEDFAETMTSYHACLVCREFASSEKRTRFLSFSSLFPIKIQTRFMRANDLNLPSLLLTVMVRRH